MHHTITLLWLLLESFYPSWRAKGSHFSTLSWSQSWLIFLRKPSQHTSLTLSLILPVLLIPKTSDSNHNDPLLVFTLSLSWLLLLSSFIQPWRPPFHRSSLGVFSPRPNQPSYPITWSHLNAPSPWPKSPWTIFFPLTQYWRFFPDPTLTFSSTNLILTSSKYWHYQISPQL